MELFRFTAGSSPLLVDVPHAGTHIPSDLADRMTPEALATPDTDWHQDLLYDFALGMGASMLVATHSRYVVDLNRPDDDTSLYPGRDTEGLVPSRTAAGQAVYKDGMEPDDTEKAARWETFHTPYHAKLNEALQDIKAEHGYALLWDAHSIKSHLPRFFDGKLWDLNLGTNHGATCAQDLQDSLEEIAATSGYSYAMNERYLGGHITRHYGDPDQGIHAVQMEMCWSTYMEEDPPYRYRDDLAAQVQPVLQRMLQTMLYFRP